MYRGRLQKDFDLWVAKGLIGQAQADALLADYDSRGHAFSIGGVLMVLAAVLLSASILMLIAAGWEDIPRLAKIGGVALLIWGFHLAAALAIRRNASRLAAALLILGSASFGGGIALVAQQYHISGDAADAMLLWFALTALSAALFRSGALTGMAGLLTWLVFYSILDVTDARWDSHYAALLLVAALAVVALVVWTEAHRAAHFIYLLALAFIFWVYTLVDTRTAAGAMAVCGSVAFLAVAYGKTPWSQVVSRAGPAPAFYALALALLGLALLHIELEASLLMAVLAVAVLGLCILALAISGRDNGAVRFLAYGAFASEVLYLSFVTIDSMLGTSGFFLVSGFVVALLAFIVVRMEKLFAARAQGESA